MTQAQRINRGTIIIFVLSIALLLCLCVTATLSYFAGNQKSNTTLIMGGPVRVAIIDRNYSDVSGQGNLVMEIKSDRSSLLPGMGIDMHAVARVFSSPTNPTKALLRAILDIDVEGLTPALAKEAEEMIRSALGECLTLRVDSNEADARRGWVMFEGEYYYCDSVKGIDSTGKEYIQLYSIPTTDEGEKIVFINGTFQMPTKKYTNKFADIDITFTLRFQAIQERITDNEGDAIPNTIFNVKQALDSVDWDHHNN